MALTTKQISELNAAASRRTAGTASATDIKNLDYATKTFGYSAPAAAPSPSPSSTPTNSNASPAAAPSSTPYTIKSGDTLSAIAASKGTTVNELLKLNPTITNPNLIYAGKSLNLPGGQGGASDSGVPDYSTVNTVQDANNAINSEQANDAATIKQSGEPETRKSVDDIMAEITSKVSPKTEKPETLNLTQSLTDYRLQYGVTDLENQLNDLKAQEQEILDQKASRVSAERGKQVATNVIAGRVSEVERQENERLAVIQRSISNATNQLNTKYNIINTLMDAKKTDYETATAAYDKEFTQNVSIFNAARDIDEDAKSELEKEQDTARANAQIALNAYTARGTAYGDLTDSEKTNLTKMGVQAGLGADFFSNVMKVSSGKDILTTITSSDDTKATIIYKDGTTKTIATGLPARKTTSSGSDKATESEIKVFYKQSMETELQKVIGEDGYVSPSDWAKARRKWATNTAYDSTDFDDSFRGYVNPDHPFDYAGFEDYKKGFIQKSSAEKEAEGY